MLLHLKIACGLALIIGLSTPLAAQSVPPAGNRGSTAPDRQSSSRSGQSLTAAQQRALKLLDQLSKSINQTELRPDEPQGESVLRMLHHGKRAELPRGEPWEVFLFKARLQAQIADLLWDYDQPRARQLFASIFRSIPPSPSGARHKQDETLLREELLPLLVRRDQVWACELVEASKDADLWPRYYMEAALHFAVLDPPQAAKLAKAAFDETHPSLFLGFLSLLRSKNAELADSLCDHALSVAPRTTQELFGSLMGLLHYFCPDCGGPSQGARPVATSKLTASLLTRYLDLTHQAVLQKAQAVELKAKRSPGTDEDVYTHCFYVEGMLTFFERQRPDQAATLRRRWEGVIRLFTEGAELLELIHSIRQSLPEMLRQAELSQDTKEKELHYQRASNRALREGDFAQALALAERASGHAPSVAEISKMHSQAALAAFDKGDFDAAYRHAKVAAEMPDYANVFGRIAQALLDKGETRRAAEVLTESVRLLSQRADEPFKVAALLSLAAAAARLDPQRGFAVTTLAVAAINRHHSIGWYNNTRIVGFGSNDEEYGRIQFGAALLDLIQAFQLLGRADFDRTVSLAQTINQKEGALLAQLFACHAVLAPPRAEQK